MSELPTPESDRAANESIVAVYETSKRLERQRDDIREMYDGLIEDHQILVGQRDEVLKALEQALNAWEEGYKTYEVNEADKAHAVIASVKGGQDA
jgi:predicted nucleic-acid-binding protein